MTLKKLLKKVQPNGTQQVAEVTEQVTTPTEQVIEQVTQQVTQQVADATQQVTQQVAELTQQVARLLVTCVGELSRAELMQAVGIKDRVSFARNYLEPSLAKNLVEMTQPDSPNSPTQKYRLTEKGKRILETIH